MVFKEVVFERDFPCAVTRRQHADNYELNGNTVVPTLIIFIKYEIFLPLLCLRIFHKK
jgi:hypothetical protein